MGEHHDGATSILRYPGAPAYLAREQSSAIRAGRRDPIGAVRRVTP
jgi:hypothetical protein